MTTFEKSLKKHGVILRESSMKKLYSTAFNIASTDANILIIGNSGTGKDFLAKYIHQNSTRSGKPFIHVNCSAIPDELFESELFGYESGAFTGSNSSGKNGLVGLAEGGTLFLDEIGELNLDLQTKLLMLVQEHRIHALGASQDKVVDIRIISATNRDLNQMVEAGQFRLDLYYRLNVVSFRIPPLRERPEDLMALIESLGQTYGTLFEYEKQFTEDAIEYLKTLPWNGNVREVQNFMEKLYVLETADTITRKVLEQNYRFLQIDRDISLLHKNILPLKQAVADFEKNYIAETIKKCSSPKEAAKLLQIDMELMMRKLK